MCKTHSPASMKQQEFTEILWNLISGPQVDCESLTHRCSCNINCIIRIVLCVRSEKGGISMREKTGKTNSVKS